MKKEFFNRKFVATIIAVIIVSTIITGMPGCMSEKRLDSKQNNGNETYNNTPTPEIDIYHYNGTKIGAYYAGDMLARVFYGGEAPDKFRFYTTKPCKAIVTEVWWDDSGTSGMTIGPLRVSCVPNRICPTSSTYTENADGYMKHIIDNKTGNEQERESLRQPALWTSRVSTSNTGTGSVAILQEFYMKVTVFYDAVSPDDYTTTLEPEVDVITVNGTLTGAFSIVEVLIKNSEICNNEYTLKIKKACKALVVEAVWDAQLPTEKILMLTVYPVGTIPRIWGYSPAQGESPQKNILVGEENFEGASDWHIIMNTCINDLEGAVALKQEFQLYISIFYDSVPDQNYSALPG